MKPAYQKGEIVNVNLGIPPKEIKGHEQGYQRPCIIVKSFPHLELAIIVPCTSKVPKINSYMIVRLTKGSGGLSHDSFVLCNQVRSISFARITGKIGKLDNQDLLKIQTVLLDILEL